MRRRRYLICSPPSCFLTILHEVPARGKDTSITMQTECQILFHLFLSPSICLLCSPMTFNTAQNDRHLVRNVKQAIPAILHSTGPTYLISLCSHNAWSRTGCQSSALDGIGVAMHRSCGRMCQGKLIWAEARMHSQGQRQSLKLNPYLRSSISLSYSQQKRRPDPANPAQRGACHKGGVCTSDGSASEGF